MHGFQQGVLVPVPLPLGVSVIDAAIELFGLLYPHISTKHRTQLIEHFVECLKVTKFNRKEAVLVNIFCGVLCAMKNIRKMNSGIECNGKKDVNKGCEELKIISQQLVIVRNINIMNYYAKLRFDICFML